MRGATLIELVIVCAVIAATMWCGLSVSHLFRASLVRIEAQQLAQIVANTARRAQLARVNMAIECSVERGYYRIGTEEHRLVGGVVFGVPEGVKGPPSHPVQLVNDPVTFARHRVELYADGRVASGTIYVTDNARSCCYAVTVPAGSYRLIRVYRWCGKTAGAAWEVL